MSQYEVNNYCNQKFRSGGGGSGCVKIWSVLFVIKVTEYSFLVYRC